jgi:hypothetical protein
VARSRLESVGAKGNLGDLVAEELEEAEDVGEP